MLKKLLKSKKTNYFLEIDDKSGQDNGKKTETSPKPAQTAKTVENKPSSQAKAEAPKAEKAPQKAAKAEKAKAPKAQPTPQPTQAQASAQPAAAKPQPKPQPKQRKEFATRYLMPNSPTPRRRPGANMQSFLDMAKDPGMRR
ncbi:MAG: Fibronectin-attachment protein (FAP) [Phormidium sp. OSCR]|nr:MAG: Fibronectin-attachment protein (FAP) [Phormidium sp. OSCR]